MPITTVTKCKAFRAIKPENKEHDDELAFLIEAAQSYLEKECLRKFDQAEVTEYFDGDMFRDKLLLSRPPITNIVNIWDDTGRLWATPITPSRYHIKDADAGIVRLLDGLQFSFGQHNIKITYVGGYAQDAMPPDLEKAVREMVWAAREIGEHNLVGVRSRSIGEGNIQFVNLDWGSTNLAPIIQKHSLNTGLS